MKIKTCHQNVFIFLNTIKPKRKSLLGENFVYMITYISCILSICFLFKRIFKNIPFWFEGFNLNFQSFQQISQQTFFCLALYKHWEYLLNGNQTTKFYSQLQKKKKLTHSSFNIVWFFMWFLLSCLCFCSHVSFQ